MFNCTISKQFLGPNS